MTENRDNNTVSLEFREKIGKLNKHTYGYQQPATMSLSAFILINLNLPSMEVK